MILSAYERARSPFVHLQYGGKDGRKCYVKTRIRKDDPDKARKTQLELSKLRTRLLTSAPSGRYGDSWEWVGNWLRQRYAGKPSTLRQYEIHWQWLAHFLVDHEISSPAMFERADAFDYIDWRRSQVKEKSGRNPGLNTTLGELKTLGRIIDEAIARGLATENPARKLGIERDIPAEKAAFTDEDIGLIYRELTAEPEWMQRAFHIALHTGLRHAETQIRREAVRWGRGEIDIIPKGGRKKQFTVQIYPSIEAMIEEFIESRRPRLWEAPKTTLVGIAWNRFFKRIGLVNVDFHSTRRTFISRGALAGIPESVMMKLVNHGSQQIHRIYQRFVATDLRDYGSRISLPSPPAK